MATSDDSKFSCIHSFAAKWEGGISDDPYDHGGLTAYGASMVFVKDIASTSSGKNFLQAIGVGLPITSNVMMRITPEQAAAMFKHEFWLPLRCDELPFAQAALLYDAAVNCGCRQAVKFSQRGYNACVGYGAPLAVDGIIGPKTIAALRKDTPAMREAILRQRADFYNNIVRNDNTQQRFLRGWLNRVHDLEGFIKQGASL